MRPITYTAFFLLFASCISLSQVVEPNSFKASNAGADVLLIWKTLDETNVKEFQIERRASEEVDFKAIGTVGAAKLPSYLFRDHSAFKKTTSIYYYRLVIVFLDNSTQPFGEEPSLDHTVSGVRRTWGSIKSMFRF